MRTNYPIISEHAETARNTQEKDVTEKEEIQHKFCTGTVY